MANPFSAFLRSFAKGMATEIVKAALAEAITMTNQEIDKLEGTTPEEKDWMKAGVAVLVKRLDALVASKLAQ